jgi:HK97 family phage major capsid protein
VLKQLRERLKNLIAERAEKVDAMTAVRDKASGEGRADFTPAEQSSWDEARARVAEIDRSIKGDDDNPGLEARIAELEELEAAEQRNADAARDEGDDAEQNQRSSGVRITNEPLTYEKGRRSRSFFRDAFMAIRQGDVKASERIARHSREMDVVYAEYRADERERRASPSANYSGLVVPQYLVEEFANVARAGKPFLNEVRNVPLPDTGMTVNIGLGTTGVSAAAQATENSAVSSTDYDDTLLTVPVRTYAGQQVVSRQAVDRGALVDSIIAEDLIGAYYAAVDSAAIASDGTSGTHKGVLSATGTNAVTFTSASPTVALLYPKFADAAWNQVPSNVFRGVTRGFMHPRRFAWVLGAVDSQGRPIAVPQPNGPVNAMAAGGEGPAYGPTGYMIQGVPIVTDANIPINLGAGTNEDRVIAAAAREIIFWEDAAAPLQLRFEETKADTLGVLFVLFGYSAFTAERRPKATSIIAGTGLVAPTF